MFVVGQALSVGGLAFAMREIPTGPAYAVWVGVGANVAIIWAMISDAEIASVVAVALVARPARCC